MKSYIISYDLHSPGRDYSSLIPAIKELGNWCHAFESFWVIQTGKTAVEVRDVLISHIDSNDQLLVISSGGEGAWRNLSADVSSWLNKNL